MEFSKTRRHFFIMAWDIFANQYHIIDLHHKQAEKLLKSSEFRFDKIMRLLDFKHNKLFIRHMDLLMSIEVNEDSPKPGKSPLQSYSSTQKKLVLPKSKVRPEFTHCSAMRETKIKTFVSNFESI